MNLIRIFLLPILSATAIATVSVASETIQNPLFAAADPAAVVLDGEVFIYPTQARHREGTMWTWRSKDLKRWEVSDQPIFSITDAAWLTPDDGPRRILWAPCLIKVGPRYLFYYSVGPQAEGFPARIGVATGDSPLGPFSDSGKPLLTGGNGFEAIDPFVFHDEPNQRYLLYAGGSDGSRLRIYELGADLVTIANEIETANPPKFTEGAFLHLRDGVYHLTYSHGRWRESSYSVHHCTSSAPTGPWTYRGVILQSDATHKGPGHHSIIQNPIDGKWFIVYHRWNKREGDGPYRGQRETAIEPLEHHGRFGIAEVDMSDEIDLGWKTTP